LSLKNAQRHLKGCFCHGYTVGFFANISIDIENVIKLDIETEEIYTKKHTEAAREYTIEKSLSANIGFLTWHKM